VGFIYFAVLLLSAFTDRPRVKMRGNGKAYYTQTTLKTYLLMCKPSNVNLKLLFYCTLGKGKCSF